MTLTTDELRQVVDEIERRKAIQAAAEECVNAVEERWLAEQGGQAVQHRDGHKSRSNRKAARQALAEQANELLFERHGYTGFRIEIKDD
jgi:hypothetical protein